jgi:hypothetical protein
MSVDKKEEAKFDQGRPLPITFRVEGRSFETILAAAPE